MMALKAIGCVVFGMAITIIGGLLIVPLCFGLIGYYTYKLIEEINTK